MDKIKTSESLGGSVSLSGELEADEDRGIMINFKINSH